MEAWQQPEVLVSIMGAGEGGGGVRRGEGAQRGGGGEGRGQGRSAMRERFRASNQILLRGAGSP